MKTFNSQQEEYRAFLKNIREEREESSNLVKLVITIIMALLCAVIVCVILVENNLFRSFDGKEIISNNKNYIPTQQDIDSFKNELNNLFQKYNYILNKRGE